MCQGSSWRKESPSVVAPGYRVLVLPWVVNGKVMALLHQQGNTYTIHTAEINSVSVAMLKSSHGTLGNLWGKNQPPCGSGTRYTASAEVLVH